MMASSMKLFMVLMFITMSFSFSISSSSPSLQPMCHPQINPILRDLKLQCPTTIVSSPPIEVNGETLDGLLSSCKPNAYTAIMFYASWCPFSRNLQPKFDTLASMYPQIKHLKVEQSSALPSVFSRYGIHSIPSVIIANKTARVHYHGPKDLHSLFNFYKETTGLEHALDFTEQDQLKLDSSENNHHPLNLTSLKDEPYLIFSIFFVLLKALLYLCPNIISKLVSLWATYVPRLNLAIFGESRQLLAHARHLFDIKSAFSKLKISKNRNFHNGARSARVLASSFASVSLGETSSSPRA